MTESAVAIQYVRSPDLNKHGHGPYRCTHRGITVQRDDLLDLDKAVRDIECDHLWTMSATQLLLSMTYHFEPVDRLPA